MHDAIVYPKSMATFWDACIGTLNVPGMYFRVAAIGPSGMAMTICTPFIIRKLLEKGHSVVYLLRCKDKGGWYYEFLPHDGKYTAEAYPERTNLDDVPSLLSDSTYYIVDTAFRGGKKTNCNPPEDFRPKVIIVEA
jgi:hypothetical protein